MHVTICIPTRDRGISILHTLHSLLASSYADWDVVIVDQSRTDATKRAVHALTDGDSRFRYIASTATGSSAARNLALTQARGPLIAFTDDDCTVLSDWLERLVNYFQKYPESGLIYGAVRAGAHDPRAGFIPDYPITHFRRIRTPLLKWRESGIGANMAGTLVVLHAVGGFDEMLGSGGPLHAYLDGDLTYRVLKAGYIVLNVPDAVVIHQGFRGWQDGRPMMHRVGIGVGAAYMKHLRLGDLAAVPTFVIEWLRCISWGRLLTLRPRSGLMRFASYGLGAMLSFRYAIDRRTRMYRVPHMQREEQPDHRAAVGPIASTMGIQHAALRTFWVYDRAHLLSHAAWSAIPLLMPLSWICVLLMVAGACFAHRIAYRPLTGIAV